MNTDSLYFAFGCAFIGTFVLAGLAVCLYDRFVSTLRALDPDVWGRVGEPPILSKYKPALDRKSPVPVLCIFSLHRRLAKMPVLTSPLTALLVSTEIVAVIFLLLVGTLLVLLCMLPI